MREVVSIPEERKAVLIGRFSRTKRAVEKLAGATLQIDDAVIIDGEPVAVLCAKNIVTAIGRGFSPQRAFRLAEDDVVLEVMDIKGRETENMLRLKRSRLIGTRGITRRLIERYTGAQMSVYGHTVSVIGNWQEMQLAKDAVQMLLDGKPHSVVYRYIEQESAIIKKVQH